MVRPVELQRFETLTDSEAGEESRPPTAEEDAKHASTGWSAYDVWRARVLDTSKTENEKP